MDTRREAAQFLTTARGRISPEQAGVPVSGGQRRVPGLRREEIAELAGVSTAYYTRIERGDLRGVSDSVLESLARALRLDRAERAQDRKSTRLNSSHVAMSYAVFCWTIKPQYCSLR